MSGLAILETGVKPAYKPAPAIVPDADLGDVIESSYQNAMTGERLISETSLGRDLLQKNAEAYQKITGRRVEDDYRLTGRKAARHGKTLDIEQFDADLPRLRQENAEYNKILSAEEIENEKVRIARENYENAQEVASRANSFERFTGGLIGSLGAAAQDPLQLPAFALGAGAPTLASKGALAVAKAIGTVAAKEAVIGGATEGAIAVSQNDWVERYTGEEQTMRDILKRVRDGALLGGVLGGAVGGVQVGLQARKLSRGDADLANMAEAAPTIEQQDALTTLSRNKTFEEGIPARTQPTLQQLAEHRDNLELAVEQFERGEIIDLPNDSVMSALDYEQFLVNTSPQQLQAVSNTLEEAQGYLQRFDQRLTDSGVTSDIYAQPLQQLEAVINKINRNVNYEKGELSLTLDDIRNVSRIADDAFTTIDNIRQPDTGIVNSIPETIKSNLRAAIANTRDIIENTFSEKFDEAIERGLFDDVVGNNPDLKQEIAQSNTQPVLPVNIEQQKTMLEAAAEPAVLNAVKADVQRLAESDPNMKAPLENQDLSVKQILDEIAEDARNLQELASCGVAL